MSAVDQLQRSVGILLDLCGPKIRTARFENDAIELCAGDVVAITTRPGIGTSGIIVSRYEGLCRDVRAGDKILLADRLIELKVTSSALEDTVCRVVHRGILSDNKGINLPGVAVSAPSLMAKDIEDVRFAMSLGVDYLALSFLR